MRVYRQEVMVGKAQRIAPLIDRALGSRAHASHYGGHLSFNLKTIRRPARSGWRYKVASFDKSQCSRIERLGRPSSAHGFSPAARHLEVL
jgi:hypothetical protein